MLMSFAVVQTDSMFSRIARSRVQLSIPARELGELWDVIVMYQVPELSKIKSPLLAAKVH
jgi:hypothetical protein